MPLELGWPRWQGSFSCRKQAAKDERLCSSGRLQEQGVEASREDHSVLDGKPAERRRHSITDPLEDLSQLVEEGQGARRRWIKPQHQEAKEQGGQQALTEGQRKEVADCRVPELAQQRQQRQELVGGGAFLV